MEGKTATRHLLNAYVWLMFLLHQPDYYTMGHQFSVAIAQKYSVNVAIFLENIAFWIEYNQANEVNFHAGLYWTFNTIESFTKLFPYWTYEQIRKIIADCVHHGLLIKGEFNKSKYDKTKWYTLTEDGLKLFPRLIREKTQIGQGENPNRPEKIHTPIPNSKPKIENADKTTTGEVVVLDNSIISKPLDRELIHLRNKWDPPEYNLMAEDDDDIDNRSDEEFLYQCKYHLEQCTSDKFNKIQQINGLKTLIKKGFREPAGYISPIEEKKRKEKERKKRIEVEELSRRRADEMFDEKNKANNIKNTTQLLSMLKG